jgi:hypothetical protein
MTDREKEMRKEELVDSGTEDFVLDDVRYLPGEEIDPDSLRPVPPVDEDGEVVEPVIDDPGGQR